MIYIGGIVILRVRLIVEGVEVSATEKFIVS